MGWMIAWLFFFNRRSWNFTGKERVVVTSLNYQIWNQIAICERSTIFLRQTTLYWVFHIEERQPARLN